MMSVMTDPHDWLSAAEAARRLALSRCTFRRHCDSMPVRQLKLPGMAARYNREDVESLMRSAVKAPTATATR